MLDKKQIWVIFLFEFKMGCETVEATCNINNTFGSEAAKEQTVQWWVKKFCKGDESLEGKEQSRQPSEVDNNQLRAIIEADTVTTTWEGAEELNVNHSTVIQHLKQIRKVKRRRQWHPTPVLLPGKSHGWRSLVGCSPWGCWELDTTERLPFHFSLSCIGEGNGNPLQCSCLENPRDRGAWWASVYGVVQSRTRLKQLDRQ